MNINTKDFHIMNRMRDVLIILFCLTIPIQTVYAIETIPQGTDAVESNQTDSLESTKSIVLYQDQITELEIMHGPLDIQLGELLLGLGLLYKTQGQYEKAGEVFERSLHIQKVNEGIQSMSQISILEALIEVNTASEKWDELNRNYHLLLWLHQRNLEPGDQILLSIIEMVARWKLLAYANQLLSESPSTTLNDLTNIYRSAIKIMEGLYGENDPRLVGPLNGLALARYQLIQSVMNTPVDDFQGNGNRTNTRIVCRLVRTSNGMMQICNPVTSPNPNYYSSKQDSKNRIVKGHMHSVRNSLSQIVEINASNSSLSYYEHATALLNLGDWFFINSMRATAIKNYKQAYQILEENNSSPNNIEKLFGKPTRIPSMTMTSTDFDNDVDNVIDGPFVKLSFNVTVKGQARKIKVIEESEPKNSRSRKLARQYINYSLFRPRFQDGEPVATQQMEVLLSGVILKRDLTQNTGSYKKVIRTRIR